MSDADFLAALNPEQRQAAAHVEGPLLILAGAGSGKTRVLTHRAVWLITQGVAAPDEILCVTFTNKACREMSERIEAMVGTMQGRPEVRTFHGLGLHLIRTGVVPVAVSPQAVIYDEADQRQLMREILDEFDLDGERINVRDVLGRIEGFKRRGWMPEDLDPSVVIDDLPMVEIYEAWQQKLLRNDALDFGDLLLQPLKAMERDPGLEARLQRRYRFVMVDEFQDTNRIQYDLIRRIAGHGNLAVVGDDDQSIYAWRGADISNILNFERDYPQTRVVRLEQNYRSTRNILDAAWNVVRHNVERKEKRLWTDGPAGKPLRLAVLGDEREEADWVARQVERLLRDGTPPAEIAIFYRTNAQSRVHEEALRQRSIPHQVVGATGFFGRKEIRDVIAYLRLLQNPADFVAFQRIANVPRRGIGKTSLERVLRRAQLGTDVFGAVELAVSAGEVRGKPAQALTRFCEDLAVLRTKIGKDGLAYLAAQTIERMGLRDAYDSEGTEIARDRRENIDQLLVSMQDWQADMDDEATLADYLDTVTLIQDADGVDDGAAVKLMTLHSAKGLEFDVVFLTGLEYGVLPHQRSIDEGNFDEERRLCYVGITRSRKDLYLTRARTRRTFGARLSQRQSPFLQDIPRELIEDRSPVAQQAAFPWSAPSTGASPRV
ncbi:MAG: ATP-dependent DNA helicase PcrA, partial [Candidatus Dadabacteria bacterium]